MSLHLAVSCSSASGVSREAVGNVGSREEEQNFGEFRAREAGFQSSSAPGQFCELEQVAEAQNLFLVKQGWVSALQVTVRVRGQVYEIASIAPDTQ